MNPLTMLFLVIFFSAIGFVLYWAGFLDRPKFQVVESILGKKATKQVYAIVTTAMDLDYVDNNGCKVLYATKEAIDKAIASFEEEEETKKLSIATSYLISDNTDHKDKATKADADENDAIGIFIFLQNAEKNECHQSGTGFLVEATSFEQTQQIARKVTEIIQSELGSSAPGLDASQCSDDRSGSSETNQLNDYGFFRAHAVALGGGPVFRGRTPLRSRIGVFVARYMQWGRAHSKYTDLTKGEKGDAAVACELYVHGVHNPAIGYDFADYLYLLDRTDREAVWKQLDTPLP